MRWGKQCATGWLEVYRRIRSDGARKNCTILAKMRTQGGEEEPPGVPSLALSSDIKVKRKASGGGRVYMEKPGHIWFSLIMNVFVCICVYSCVFVLFVCTCICRNFHHSLSSLFQSSLTSSLCPTMLINFVAWLKQLNLGWSLRKKNDERSNLEINLDLHAYHACAYSATVPLFYRANRKLVLHLSSGSLIYFFLQVRQPIGGIQCARSGNCRRQSD